jgi:hypothetical protein
VAAMGSGALQLASWLLVAEEELSF